MNEFEEDKIRKANQESIRRESVESQLPKIREEGELISGRGFRKMVGSEFTSRATGYRHRRRDVGERCTGMGEIITTDEIEGIVGDERLELREEQVQCVGKKGNEEEQQVLAALPLLGEVILGQCKLEFPGKYFLYFPI